MKLWCRNDATGKTTIWTSTYNENKIYKKLVAFKINF